MSKLFLHVGMPKTGTSFIQGFVNANKKLMKEMVEFDFLSGRMPHEIACHLITNEALFDRVDIKGLRAADFVESKKQLDQIKNEGFDCFCSSEYFVLSNKNEVVRFFSNYFDEIEIIYTVRRQDKLMASGFNQEVKALNRTSNLVWAYKNAITIRYFQNCKAWEEVGCRVRVIDYDAVKKANNGLNRAIFSLFLDADALFVQPLREPDTNAFNYSLSENELLIKLCLNRLNLENDELMQEFRSFESIKSEFSLPPVYTEVIASCYLDENQALVAEYIDSETVSDLTFQGISIDKSISIEEARFDWDPLAKNRTLVEFFLRKAIGLQSKRSLS
jgi:hypothetical protein